LSLLTELQRRNVFKVGAAYLVVGWLVIQAAALLAPQLNLPEWAPRLVTFLVLIAFPLVLVLSWIFDLTPQGLQVAQGRVGNKRFYAIVGALTVLALGWFFAGQRGEAPASMPAAVATMDSLPPAPAPPASPANGATPSIAVLPFVNMSPDQENEYFADGIAEELLNILARIPGLKVASRTSAFSFKGSSTPVPAIARTLQVEHVLEGSVRKQGDRVRITAQLVHAASDAHLWSNTYDRQLVDIFKVQEEIAQSITTALAGMLGARRVSVTAPTRDLEAYERYLRGRSRFFQRADLDDALADFQFAVARDPRFAEAWAFLAATAQVHSASRYPTRLDRGEIGRLVEPAADRALALDSELPLILAVKGYALMGSDMPGERIEGFALMERAAAAEIGDSTARMWLGLHRLRLGWIDRALPVLESAFESDPLVGINVGYLGLAHFLSGNEAEGERLAQRALELSDWLTAAAMLSFEYANRGDIPRSRTWLERTLRRSTDEPGAVHVGHAYERALRDPEAHAAYLSLAAPLSLGTGVGIPDLKDLQFAIATGNADAVFAELAPRASWAQLLWVSIPAWMPSMEWLREEPRFYALMVQSGYVGLWEQFGFPLDCLPVDDPAGRRLECGGN
jgi:TolB-like protein/tetratricopeptide (TPR) repeat protein